MVASGILAWLQSRFCICSGALSLAYIMGTRCMCGAMCERSSGSSGHRGCVQGWRADVAVAESPDTPCLTAGLHIQPTGSPAFYLLCPHPLLLKHEESGVLPFPPARQDRRSPGCLCFLVTRCRQQGFSWVGGSGVFPFLPERSGPGGEGPGGWL